MKLVTGAGGFIGSNLVAALEAKGHEIAVCDWLDAPEKIRNLENRRIAERISRMVFWRLCGTGQGKLRPFSTWGRSRLPPRQMLPLSRR